MKLTKKAEKLIDRRTRLASKLITACDDVDDLIEELGIEDEVDSCDFLTGAEIYVNPWESGERIKEVIRNHRKENIK